MFENDTSQELANRYLKDSVLQIVLSNVQHSSTEFKTKECIYNGKNSTPNKLHTLNAIPRSRKIAL